MPTPFAQTYFHGTHIDLAIGEIEDDPNLTNKRFPGNPTKSYRSRHPFVVVGEVTGWQGHAQEQVAAMKASLASLHEAGVEAEE